MNKLEIARLVRESDHAVDSYETAIWSLLKHCLDDEGVIADVISIMLRAGIDGQVPAHWVRNKPEIKEIINIYSSEYESINDTYSGDLFIYTFLHVYDESYDCDRYALEDLCETLEIEV